MIVPKTVRTVFILFLLWVFVPFSVVLARAQSKNFYFSEVMIDVRVARDGSFTVDEYRTYDFQGSFSWAKLWIPLRVDREGYRYDVAIEGFHILDEQGRPLRTEIAQSRDQFEAKWYYSASNIKRTFHFHYILRGGITSYPDVSELYWQIIGDGWDKPAQNIVIDVYLPQEVKNREEILVYGHGPLSGRAEIIDRKTARFTVPYLAANQFVEIRVIWPAGMVDGVPSSRHTLQSIREEEARFVRETVDRVKRDRETRERKRNIFQLLLVIWGVWLVIGSLVWLFLYRHYWKKVGRDYEFEDIPEYQRELPSKLSPALVEVLLREGREVTPRSFTATLFDLARRGYVELDDQLVEVRRLFRTKKEIRTTVILKKEFYQDPGLFSYEVEFLKLLFVTVVEHAERDEAKFTLEELKDYFEKKPREFQKWYREWQKSIETEAKKLEFIEPRSTRMRNIFMAVTFPLAALTFNFVLLVLAAILIPKIKRRDIHWARENELWKALERFLDDFSGFKKLPPESYKLWEHYLVFGIIFGNAKRIIDMLPLLLKDERAVAPVWYSGFDRGHFVSTGRIESMIQNIEAMSSSIQQACAVAAHYSSGGGGGFCSLSR